MTTRMARCYCGRTVPSNAELPFFEDRGPDSRYARVTCSVCKRHDVTHTDYAGTDPWHQELQRRDAEQPGKFLADHPFTPASAETDVFYCGCRGWD